MATALGTQAGSVHYEDAAKALGLTVSNVAGAFDRKDYILETTGNGVAIFDFDGDGHNDILIANGTRFDLPDPAPPQLYRNDGQAHFTDVARQSGLVAVGWGQGVCAGDYDNDGHPDVLLTYYGHNRLFHNEGRGQFAEATASAGLPTDGTRWGAGCGFLDYDRDGLLDLFVSNYVDLDLAKTPKPGGGSFCEWKGLPVMCGPRGLPLAFNVLYHNEGGGKFRDVSGPAGILKPGGRYGLGVVTADFDNDGWADIYVGCDMTPSLLYRNRQDGTFEERGLEAGVAVNFDGQLQAGMGVAVADYDGNGFLDIAKTNFSGDLPSLYNNEDGQFFTDVAHPAGLGVHQLLGWGIAFVDADEDGWPDLILANGHVYPEVDKLTSGDRYLQATLFYRNLGNGRFADQTSTAGPAFGKERPARGMATGDLDGDGHPEVVIVNMNEPPSLLRNTAPHRNALVVALEGVRSNRSAIGARVTVAAGGRKQVKEVVGGGGYFSQNSFALHFGLADAKTVDRLEIRWPLGAEQSFEKIAANQALRIREGVAEITAAPLKR